MKSIPAGLWRRTWKPALYVASGALLVTGVVFALYVGAQEDLLVWHEAKLDEEFTEDSEVGSFEEYLALEERLFRQLDETVYDRVPESARSEVNRYTHGSRCDPARWDRDWNRTFELEQADPKAAVLLLHGMSDSPYSMRNLALALHGAGAWCIGMRMPGHGTAPSGLTRATWEDMAAAVRLGVRHMRARIGNRPLFLVGYSNGGALAVHYALTGLDDASVPRIDRIALLSPMIGVTPAAALAIWQERIGRLLGIDKLKWNSVTAEYDPFKYGSFAVNAGNQTYRLTREIGKLLERAKGSEGWKRFPPILALQSAADGTVSAPALISILMDKLPENGSELMIFDINRAAAGVGLVRHDPGPELAALLKSGERPFALSVVTNRAETDRTVVLRRIAPHESAMTEVPLGLEWPRDLFSLSHIALPFPAHDPLYGNGSGSPSPGIRLGDLALRGERGVLRVSPGDILRIRWNPFYSYLERRTLEFFGLAGVND